ncbi:MAG: ATP synthase F1 subunit delta [Pseudomonadota bacterium]
MISKIVAKRYAKALFVVGKEDNKLDEYHKEIAGIAKVLQELPELADALTNPAYPSEGKLKLMSDVAGAVKLSPIMTKFVKLLVQKRRVPWASDIGEMLQKLVDEYQGVKRAEVTSAVPLDADTRKKIQDALEKATSKKVVLSVREDPAILGGLVVRAGDMVYDGSVSTQLMGVYDLIKRGEGI